MIRSMEYFNLMSTKNLVNGLIELSGVTFGVLVVVLLVKKFIK